MMEPIFEFHKQSHPLSRIDPRLKLLTAIIILAMVISYGGFILPLTVFLAGIGLSISLKIPPKSIILRYMEPLFIAMVLIAVKFLSPGSHLREGGILACRILGAVSVMTVLNFSTSFTEFLSALSWFRIPAAFIDVLVFAYRYIFVLHEDADTIYSAQKNRLGYAKFKDGISSLGTLTGSLFLKAFDHSQSISTAMLQRGYDGYLPKQHHKPFRFGEIMASVMVIIVLGLIWRI